MSTHPMLTAEGVLVSTELSTELVEYEAQTFRFRRACAALLLFSVACARPWPSVGWIGIVASLTVFAAPNGKASLLCRTRLTRFLAFVVALIAGYSVISLAMSIHAGKPQAFATAVHDNCLSMPADTFEWGNSILSEHRCMSKGLAFFSRYMPKDEPNISSIEHVTHHNNYSASLVVEQEKEAWSQPAVCHRLSYVVARVAKMAMIGSALVHLLLFFSALCVVKRACRLRCAAYRAGVLTWNCGRKCKCACRGGKSNDIVKPVAEAAAPTTKEMA